jgi:hypothetical protein
MLSLWPTVGSSTPELPVSEEPLQQWRIVLLRSPLTAAADRVYAPGLFSIRHSEYPPSPCFPGSLPQRCGW